jgi:ethanolamine transporter EutH
MNTTESKSTATLEDQRAEFSRSRFLAMPIAGAIAWTFIGIAGALFSAPQAALALFIGTGAIFYLGLLIARFTGEDLLGKKRKNNFFDRLFLLTVLMAVLVYAIAIPFFLIERTSLPLSVGILTGLMWIPFSGIIQHWVGIFHGIARTVLIVAAWFLFPERRFVVIPVVIVGIYLITIYILAKRPAVAR